MKKESFEGTLPNKEPQAPRSVSIDQINPGSRVPAYNGDASCSHEARETKAGEPSNEKY